MDLVMEKLIVSILKKSLRAYHQMQLGILLSLNQMIRQHYELKKSNYANMVLKVPLEFTKVNKYTLDFSTDV